MKQTLLALILITVALAAFSEAAEQKGSPPQVPPYNPAAVYRGDHKDDIILFRNTPDSPWQRIPRLDRFRHISCPGALEGLKRTGRWLGHLNLDGSCGPAAEPSEWITGNRLNYEDSLE